MGSRNRKFNTNHSGRDNAKYKYPLRKVVARGVEGEYYGYHAYHFVKLECGHLAIPTRDWYGETGSLSQRCRMCYEEKNQKMNID